MGVFDFMSNNKTKQETIKKKTEFNDSIDKVKNDVNNLSEIKNNKILKKMVEQSFDRHKK